MVGWLVVARFATWSRPRVARPKTTPACIQLSVLLHPARIQLAVRFVPSMHVLSGPMLIQVYRPKGVANHDLQRVKYYVKTHANQCKSLQIRLQIKVLFPEDCNAYANHDLRLDLQLANHDLRSANHTLVSTWASYALSASLWSLLGPIWSLSLIFGIVFRVQMSKNIGKRGLVVIFNMCLVPNMCIVLFLCSH